MASVGEETAWVQFPLSIDESQPTEFEDRAYKTRIYSNKSGYKHYASRLFFLDVFTYVSLGTNAKLNY